ncbi:MAG: hypothetical protein JOZ07_10650 [Solirubrobacterales bacterium]|nr:hypothetical protein [Solirubrobacterales bacterium]
MASIEVNEHRSLTKLGTRAVYRVLSFDDALVWVEVVTAPGLTPGRRLRLTRSAVEAMTPSRPEASRATPRHADPPVRDRATG